MIARAPGRLVRAAAQRVPVAVALIAMAPAVASPPVVLDGSDGEWRGRTPVLVDPPDAGGAAIDLGALHVAADESFVFWRLELGGEVNLQKLPSTVEILLDADGDPATGRREGELDGVDLAVVLSPRDPARPDEPGQGVTVRWAGAGPPGPEEGRPNPAYALDWVSAPTHSSDWFEMRLRRGPAWPGGPALFEGRAFTTAVRVLAADGSVLDRTAPATVWLDAAVPPVRRADDERDPLARPERADLRIVSWNTQWGGLFDDPKSFGNVLQALRPDVLLLQELPDRHPGDELRALLDDVAPPGDGGRWQVVHAEGGGNLRCAVAAVRPLTPLPALRLVAYPQRPDRSVRVAGALLDDRDRSIALASVHLTCCGGLGEERDERRQTEASLVSAALRRARETTAFDAVIIAGDFNLVGSALPLELMGSGLGRDGADLVAAPALQLDGRSNVSWADPAQPFAPGRLDFLLHGGAVELVGSFTLDTHDLEERWRERYDLNVNDTQSASDHLPLVADFAIGPAP